MAEPYPNPMTTPKRLPPTGTVLNDILADIELKKQNNPDLMKIDMAVNKFRELMNPMLADIKSLRSNALMTSENKESILKKLAENIALAAEQLTIVNNRVGPGKVSDEQLISNPLREVAQIKDTLVKMNENFRRLNNVISAELRANEESKIKREA